ncbi:MAG: TetR/AcrR family transcriptional repressor of nem operon [Planctomycetota bacterium]
MVNTALGLQGHDEEVQLLVSAALQDFESFFVRLIDHGKLFGVIPVTVKADATASGLLAALIGICVMARGAGDDEMMRQAADQALRLLS